METDAALINHIYTRKNVGPCDEKREAGKYGENRNDRRRMQQRKRAIKMVDGITRMCLDIRRVTDTPREAGDREAGQVMIVYVREQGTWLIHL